MLELLLALLNDERDDHAGDKGEGDRNNYSEVDCLCRTDTTLEDVEYWEGRSVDSEFDWFLRYTVEDRLVHVLGEVGHRGLRGRIDEQVDLIFVRVFVRLIDLIRAETERFLAANFCLVRDPVPELIVVFIRCVVIDFEVARVGQVCEEGLWGDVVIRISRGNDKVLVHHQTLRAWEGVCA